ncbi:MAG: hypothetical protein L0I76_20150 [Pseudonocardia sp.]|nr:hypothetical protein [Pseudonocardia sp.]
MQDTAFVIIQRAKTDGLGDWVVDPSAHTVYVDHHLTGESYAQAAADGTLALFLGDTDSSRLYRHGRYRGPGRGVEWSPTDEATAPQLRLV